MTKPLTRQERLVLLYITDELTNGEIATIMNVTKNTVKVHKYNLYKKLGVQGTSKEHAHNALVLFGEENPDLFLDLIAPEVEYAEAPGEVALA